MRWFLNRAVVLLMMTMHCIFVQAQEGDRRLLDSAGIYDISNGGVVLDDSSGYFLVLKNNRSCLNCFESLDEFVSPDEKLKKLVIQSSENSMLERKRHVHALKKLMPSFTACFHYQESSINLFDSLGIDHTPAVIMLKKGRMITANYNEIFNSSSTGLSDSFIQKFSSFFNE